MQFRAGSYASGTWGWWCVKGKGHHDNMTTWNENTCVASPIHPPLLSHHEASSSLVWAGRVGSGLVFVTLYWLTDLSATCPAAGVGQTTFTANTTPLLHTNHREGRTNIYTHIMWLLSHSLGKILLLDDTGLLTEDIFSKTSQEWWRSYR